MMRSEVKFNGEEFEDCRDGYGLAIAVTGVTKIYTGYAEYGQYDCQWNRILPSL